MQNNQLDIIVNGDFVRNLQLNNGTNLFRALGPGSLQGNDAKEGLIVALNDPIVDDTYTEIPLMVDDTGISTPQGPPATTTPVQHADPESPPPVCPYGSDCPDMGNCGVEPASGVVPDGHTHLPENGRQRSSFPYDRATPPYTSRFASQRHPLAYIFLHELPPDCLKSGNNGLFQDRVPEFAVLCNLL